MKLRIIRIGLALAGNAIGLLIASLLLGDDMDLSGLAFVLAVLIFTVLTVVLEPIVSKLAEKSVEALQGASALIAAGLSLVLTAWISDGLSIDGVGTWVIATVVVWLSATILGVLFAKLVIGRISSE